MHVPSGSTLSALLRTTTIASTPGSIPMPTNSTVPAATSGTAATKSCRTCSICSGVAAMVQNDRKTDERQLWFGVSDEDLMFCWRGVFHCGNPSAAVGFHYGFLYESN